MVLMGNAHQGRRRDALHDALRRAAKLRILHEQRQAHYDGEGDADDHKILIEYLHACDLKEARRQQGRERDGLRAPYDLRDRPQHQRRAQRTDHRHKTERVTDGTVDRPFDRHADQSGKHTREQDRRRNRQDRHHGKRHERAEHIQIAMRKVDAVEQAVNHAVSHSDHE